MQYIIATCMTEHSQVKCFLLILTRIKVEGYNDRGINSISFTIFLEILGPEKKWVGLGLIA